MPKEIPNYENAPDHVKEYYQKLNRVDRYLRGRDHIIFKAVTTALDDLYEDGHLFTERLKEDQTRDKTVNTIRKFFVNEYEKNTGIKPQNEDTALRYFTGKNGSELDKLILQQSKEEDLSANSLYEVVKAVRRDRHESQKDYNAYLQKIMYDAAGSHLKEEHLNDIVNFLNHDGNLEKCAYLDRIQLDDAKHLLQTYRNFDGLNQRKIERSLGGAKPPYLKEYEGVLDTETELDEQIQEASKGQVRRDELYQRIKDDEVSNDELMQILSNRNDDRRGVISDSIDSGDMAPEKQAYIIGKILRSEINGAQSEEDSKRIRKIIQDYMQNPNIDDLAKQEIKRIIQESQQRPQQRQMPPQRPPPQQPQKTLEEEVEEDIPEASENEGKPEEADESQVT